MRSEPRLTSGQKHGLRKATFTARDYCRPVSPKRPEIPLTVVGGYLGAGKTTLVNRVLRDPGGRRIAVLVNDFGAIDIDSELIESEAGETISLTNGCVCCSMGGELLFQLAGLRDRDDPPEHILIEASGVGDPSAIAMYGDVPGFRRDGTIVVVDASAPPRRDPEVELQVEDQLRGAHLIVLNKTDVASPEAVESRRDGLAGMARFAQVLETSHADVPTEVLLGARRGEDGSEQPEHEHEHREHPDYATWNWSADTPLDGKGLTELLPALPAGVMRGKGFLHLREEPDSRFEFQLVGRSWHIKRLGSWEERDPRSQVVLIGLPGSIDPPALDSAFSGLS